jgi:hypothetical protein
VRGCAQEKTSTIREVAAAAARRRATPLPLPPTSRHRALERFLHRFAAVVDAMDNLLARSARFFRDVREISDNVLVERGDNRCSKLKVFLRRHVLLSDGSNVKRNDGRGEYTVRHFHHSRKRLVLRWGETAVVVVSQDRNADERRYE